MRRGDKTYCSDPFSKKTLNLGYYTLKIPHRAWNRIITYLKILTIYTLEVAVSKKYITDAVITHNNRFLTPMQAYR
jgi:hypothetical protein